MKPPARAHRHGTAARARHDIGLLIGALACVFLALLLIAMRVLRPLTGGDPRRLADQIGRYGPRHAPDEPEAEGKAARTALGWAGSLLRSTNTERGLAQRLDWAGIARGPAEWVLLTRCGCVVLAGALTVLVHSALLGIPIGLLAGWLAVHLYVSFKIGRRRAAFSEQLPDVLQLIAGSLQSVRARLDFGRIVMVPVAAAILVLDVTSLTRGGRDGGGPARWAGAALVCAFYTLMIWCYLRRGRAVATSGSVTGYAAAVTATFLPLTLPLLRGAPPGAVQRYVGYLLVMAGTGWAIWSVRFLGRSISVIAQAREVVDRGPYRLVRHPLYLGELVSALGVGIVAGTAWALCAWVALCLMQAYRAVREEQVLLQALPGYRSYRARTAALLPGFF